jgi:TolB-like protein/Flp pilus assembly protein TadD
MLCPRHHAALPPRFRDAFRFVPDTLPSSQAGAAVFLSYAREDTATVQRIADALRAAGVEVWFDRNELTGGDAWDAKIRGQIKSCGLFVPVISAATQARREGYFRIEWKLAAQRTHAIADGTPFLVPVSIDATGEGEALVPEEFRSVQWTRLPGGETSAKFSERVIRLLAFSAPNAGVTTAPFARERAADGPHQGSPRSRKNPWRWASALALILVLAVAGWRFFRQPAPAKSGEKTLAVVPFVTSSGDKEEETVADGIADELLTQLGRAPGLRVSGRLSAFSFKGQKLTDAAIAQKLGVEFLVTGTFQKNGSQVRVRPSLVNAANGSILWSETFTKELTNVFALQDEIAGLIAQKLQLKLGATARAARTVNPVAYGLVQKGRYLWLKRSDAALAEALEAYEQAIALDPDYAEAYAGLADTALVRGWYIGLEVVNQSARYYAQARAAALRALEIDATLAEPHATLGVVNMNEDHFDEAEQEFQRALHLNPNYSYAHHWRAHLLAARGHLDEAIAEMERAVQIDPYSLSTLVIGSMMQSHADRFADALAFADRAVAVRQNDFIPADGMRALSLFQLGRPDEATTAARVVTKSITTKPRWWIDISAMYVLRKSGHEAEARAHADRLLGLGPDSYFRVYIAAAFGRADEALNELRKTPVPPTNRTMIFYSEVWAEVRQSPRFPEVMRELGWWKNYEAANATKTRMLKEAAAKK